MEYVVFSHASALEYWRQNEIEMAGRLDRLKARDTFSCDLGLAGGLPLASYATPASPVHMLVRRQEDRRPSPYVMPHVASWVDQRSLLKIRAHALIASPELTLLQFAEGLSMPLLLELAHEFCGTYRLDQVSERGFVDAEPLTSTSLIKKFIDCIPHRTRGREKLARAVSFLSDGSASPRETAVAIMLALPLRMGGYGLGGFELNGAVQMSDAARELYRSSVCKCDVLWRKARVAIEYDSDYAHTGSERLAKDSNRRAALLEEGYTVIALTRTQVNQVGKMNGVAQLIADRIGKRSRASERTRAVRAELRKALLSPHFTS